MCKQTRNAYTLLELLASSAITAAVLVGTLALTRDSMSLSRRVGVRYELTTLGVSKLEEHLARTAADFASGTATGDFSSEGFPNLRYRVVRTDSRTAGGLLGRLMSITATVWEDADGNGALNQDELTVSYSTKVARLGRYQNAASP